MSKPLTSKITDIYRTFCTAADPNFTNSLFNHTVSLFQIIRISGIKT